MTEISTWQICAVFITACLQLYTYNSVMQDVEKYNKFLADNVRRLRKERHFSQEYLAELIDRSREHINRLEKCKETIGFPTFIRLAQVFNVSLDELAGFEK